MRAPNVVDQRRVLLDRVGPPHRAPACGRSRAAAADGSAARSSRARATSSTISRRAVHRLERADAKEHGRARPRRLGQRASAARAATTRASRSRPYEPRWTPVSAISLKPAARDALDLARRTSSIGTLRGAPRVVGMMQYEHGSAQPVCTRSVNAVRPATPGSIDAPQPPSPSPKRSAVVRVRRVAEPRRDQAAACRRSERPGRHSAASPTSSGRARRVAAGHDDARGGVGARDAPDGLPRTLIGASPSPNRC